MVNGRGTWVLADALYWFFYIPLTAIIVIALVIIPTNLLRDTIQPVELDAQIMEERLIGKITKYSPVMGQRTGEAGELTQLALSEKRHAYKVMIDGEVVVGNQDFYDEAIPLTPIKHKRFTFTTTLHKEGREASVTIDQVYPERYG